MVSAYICSTETSAGKTSLSVGLLRRFARDLGPVGYLKPVGVSEKEVEGRLIDPDPIFVKQVLGLVDPLEVLSPVVLTLEQANASEGQLQPELAQRIKDSYAQVARGRKAVVVEGPRDVYVGSSVGLPAAKVVEMIQAKPLLVVKYRGEATVDAALKVQKELGVASAGCVLNSVPAEHEEYAAARIKPELESAGLSVFGVLPADRTLLGASVLEMAEHLGGKILVREDRAGMLAENVMIGARSLTSALHYFVRKENKAVVASGDRPDLQLAALETSVSCIISTGHSEVDPLVVQRADMAGVPVIKVEMDTVPTLERLEDFLVNVRFRQSQKVQRVDELLSQGVDFARLYSALGLS